LSGLSDGELLAWLDGSANADHDFSAMGEKALGDMVTFLQEGMVDVAPFIDAETKAAIGGDDHEGGNFYKEVCASCHGDDGRLINFGDEEEPEYLGTIKLSEIPWEFIHKVRAGPAQRALPLPRVEHATGRFGLRTIAPNRSPSGWIYISRWQTVRQVVDCGRG
jgi:thiosulfate dehydrogenase